MHNSFRSHEPPCQTHLTKTLPLFWGGRKIYPDHTNALRKAGLFIYRTNPNWQKLNHVGKECTHTPGTLRAITSGLLNRLAKLTSQKPSLHSEGVEKIYPDYENALLKAGLVPTYFPTMGDLWRNPDEKVDMKKTWRKKNWNVYFCVSYSRYFSTSIHRVINRLNKYFNLS